MNEDQRQIRSILSKMLWRDIQEKSSSVTQPPVIQSTPFFNLIGLPFMNDLLDYLSLRDLHSLSRTCKAMEEIAGEFFRKNYSNLRTVCSKDTIKFFRAAVKDKRLHETKNAGLKMHGFNKFITSLEINDISLFPYKYISCHAGQFEYLKKLSIADVTPEIVLFIEPILDNIEVLTIKYCRMDQSLYELILRYCPKLKRLNINMDITSKKSRPANDWLLEKYPNLEHLQLFMNRCANLNDLNTFFKHNPNVRNFSCNTYVISSFSIHQPEFKLDTLEVKRIPRCEHLWKQLKKLHDQCFYKRLHICTEDNLELNKAAAIIGMSIIQEISIDDWDADEPTSTFTHLTHFSETNQLSMDQLLVERFGIRIRSNRSFCLDPADYYKNCLNIEYLYLEKTSRTHIMTLIQNLKNLKILILVMKTVRVPLILNLNKLNAEREKLDGAKKVTIYVPNEDYTATKWASKGGRTDFGLVAVKRVESLECNSTVHQMEIATDLPDDTIQERELDPNLNRRQVRIQRNDNHYLFIDDGLRFFFRFFLRLWVKWFLCRDHLSKRMVEFSSMR